MQPNTPRNRCLPGRLVRNDGRQSDSTAPEDQLSQRGRRSRRMDDRRHCDQAEQATCGEQQGKAGIGCGHLGSIDANALPCNIKLMQQR